MRYAQNLIVCVVLAGVHPGFAMPEDAPPASPPPAAAPLNSLYNQIPEFNTAMMGYFSSDVALVDLDRDGDPELLLANGSDMSPQSLTVFRNHRKTLPAVFRSWPEWYSDVTEYMSGLAVGDINQDGWMDVAVAVAFNKSREISSGSVKVFLNAGGVLRRNPDFETAPDGFMASDCALADVDVDGDLDLIVTALIEGSGIWGEDPLVDPPLGRARIYLNRGGKLSPKPDWISEDRLGAGSVIAADIDQDGWMDLAFGSPRPKIFFGTPATTTQITIPRTPGWSAAELLVKATIPFFSIDAGAYGKVDQESSALPAVDAGLMLAVSAGCATSRALPCDSSVVLYRPSLGTGPIWSSDTQQFPGAIALADLNQDGYLDLVFSQWTTSLPGGPILLFQGPFPTGTNPSAVIKVAQLWQGFSLGNVHCGPAGNATLRHSFTINSPVNVLTLPQRILSEVLEVSQDGIPLSPKLWTWTPETNWVSLAKPVTDTVISVTYKVPTILDLAAASWNPNAGSGVFFNQLKVCTK